MLPGLTVRPEAPANYEAVRRVHTLAFDGPVEAKLVDALRDSDAYVPELSLVAELEGHVVGHILFTHVTVEAAGGVVHDALALAPLGVEPSHQRRGIGTALVREGLAACERLGEAIVIVLGHPTYYTRFGFVRASRYGIMSPFPVPDEAFMVLDLAPGALDGVGGTVRYPPPFDAV